VADESDQALLDRVATGISSLGGLEKSADARPAQFRPAGAEAWVRQQYDANPDMWPDYLQAGIRHPHLFQNGTASVMLHVEPVVRHFARGGLTRSDYFKAVAADPQLLLQKPAEVIRNLETVMDHYAADSLMRSDYIQAAVDQPILFRTRPEAVFAAIEATVDRMESQGITRSDCLRQAVDRPRLFTQGPEAIWAPMTPETHPALPEAPSSGQAAASSPLPSTFVHNPALYVSYVGPAQGRAR
jgi:hypothetical protein